MLKINIVTEPNPGWILAKMSEQWGQRIPNCTVSHMRLDETADINYYVHWELYQCVPNPSRTKSVAWFTHRGDTERNARWDDVSKKVDYCICGHSSRLLKFLPKNKSKVIKPGVHPQFSSFKKKITFGIVGQEYAIKRKGFEYVNQLSDIPNTEFKITGGKIPFEELPRFYSEIDYLLVLSNNEAGPMPVVEAMSIGKPVIAPNVGWCWNYPVIKFDNIEELRDIIKTLSSYTNTDKPWIDSSKELMKIFTSLVE
jgi:hypothetical protein